MLMPISYVQDRRVSGQLLRWVIIWFLAGGVAWAQTDSEKPLYDREPFDRLTLDPANKSAQIEIFPIDSVDRTRPVLESSKSLFTIRRLQDPPERLYRVSKRHIEKFELFHEMLQAAAQEFITAQAVDEAFPYVARLVNDYPNTAGLEKLVEEFYFADARHLFEQERFDEALVSLDEVYARNAGRAGLDRVIRRVLSEIIRIEYRAQRYESVLSKVQYAQRRYGNVAGDLVKEWEQRLRQVAEQRIATARTAFEQGDAISALAANREALRIWPASSEAAKLRRDILAKYPRVRVGVSQMYVPQTPTSKPPPRILDWAERRTGPLLQRGLIEFAEFTSEGGRYDCPIGKLQIGSDRKFVTISLNTGTGGYELCRALLRVADPRDDQYSERWSEFLGSVFVPNAGTIELQLTRPFLQPEGLFPRRLPLTEALQKALRGDFLLENRAADSQEINFRLRAGQESPPRGVTQIVERYFEDQTTMADALIAGEIDVIDRVHAGDLERLRAIPEITVSPYQIPSIHFLVFNDREPLLRSSTFRRGLLYGINRARFVDQFAGTGQPISAPLPIGKSIEDPLGYAYSKPIKPRVFDPSLAHVLLRLASVQRQLLTSQAAKNTNASEKESDAESNSEEALQDTALPLVIAYPQSPIARSAATSIRFDLRRLGLDVSTRQLPPGVSVPEDDEWDILYVEASIEEPFVDLPDLVLGQSLLGRHGGLVWQATRSLQSSADLQEAREQFARIHKLSFDHTPLLPLWQLVEHLAYRRDVRGIGEEPVTLYETVSQWRFEP